MEIRLMNVATQARMNKTLRYQEHKHKSQQIYNEKLAEGFSQLQTTKVYPSVSIITNTSRCQNVGEQIPEVQSFNVSNKAQFYVARFKPLKFVFARRCKM